MLLQALGLVPVGRASEALPLLERSKAVLLEADPLIAPAEVFAFGAQVAMWLERYDLAEDVLDRQITILRGASGDRAAAVPADGPLAPVAAARPLDAGGRRRPTRRSRSRARPARCR